MERKFAMDQLKAAYDEKGYVIGKNLIPDDLVDALRSTIDGIVRNGSGLTESDDVYEILEDIETRVPRIERIKSPHNVHAVFDEVIHRTEITDILKTLLGPNVRLQNSKLNLKSSDGSAPVEWHQDWAFYPHTNDDVLAVGVMIDDMTEGNGPVLFAPGTHRGPIFDHLSNGYFCGAVSADVAKSLTGKYDTLIGSAGTVTFHHARLLHASLANQSGLPRRFLLYEVMAADAWPLAGCSATFESWQSMNSRMIIGKQYTTPRLTAVPVRMPQPEPPKVSSIFQLQRDGDNNYYMDGTNS